MELSLAPILAVLKYPEVYLLLVILLVSYWYLTIPSKLPPGPFGWPIIGSLLQISRGYPEKELSKLCRKYGDVVSLYLGSRLIVVLGSYEAIKDAYVKQADVFAGRPDVNPFSANQDDRRGLVAADGENWKEHRRFALSTLRDFGFGKLSLEPKITDEIQHMLNELATYGGRPVYPLKLIGVSVANLIAELQFGQRFGYKDEEFNKLRAALDVTNVALGSFGPRFLFPFISRIPGVNRFSGQRNMENVTDIFETFAGRIIGEHEKVHDSGNCRDYIDAYLTERNRRIDKTGEEGIFDLGELTIILRGLYAAGSGTITTSILWSFLYMMHYPEVQRKVQAEIENVIGRDRTPSMADKRNLPYTEATMLEISRCASVVPLNLMHRNFEEAFVLGHRIPKGTYILSNLWAIHHDPKNWTEPEAFRPERFLNDKGEVVHSEYLMSFSVGKRACLGESLARMEMFLYFTSLLQRFTFEPPPCLLSLGDYEVGLTRNPKPFQICAIEHEGFAKL